jgi:hypothetical protein
MRRRRSGKSWHRDARSGGVRWEDRRAAVEELVDGVLVNGVFEVVCEMTPA